VLAVILAATFVTLVSIGFGTATVRHCTASDFKLRQGPEQSALAHYRQTVRLRNVSKTTCAMSGWFMVKLLNAHGKVLRSREQRITSDMFGTSAKSLVTVKPGRPRLLRDRYHRTGDVLCVLTGDCRHASQRPRHGETEASSAGVLKVLGSAGSARR
jgi:hypothetical protein